MVIDPTGGATELAIQVTDVTVPSGADPPTTASNEPAAAALTVVPVVPAPWGSRGLLIVIGVAVVALAGATAVVMRRARPA